MSDPASPDCVFAALAHPARRRMLDLLVEHPGASVKALASHFEFSRIAAMKHIATLEAANLVLSSKEGRTKRLYFNPIPIQQIYDRWTTQYSSFWAGRMADVPARVEGLADERRNQGA
jgi:DNA-binding transcriptional ArsR family regulator